MSDHLGWPAARAVSLYGLRIGFRANSTAALERALSLIPVEHEPAVPGQLDHLYSLRLAAPANGRATRRMHTARFSAIRIARTSDESEFWSNFERHLHEFLAEFAADKIFVHAGVVGWRGQAIVFPGRSYAGKSTLTAALLQAGATYYSDEYAVLDAAGRVHPFPRPLSIRSSPTLLPTRHPYTEFGSLVGTGAIDIGMIIVTAFREGGRWRPRRLTAGQSMVELARNTVGIRQFPERAMSVLGVAASAPAVKSARGDVDCVVRYLDRHIS